MRTAELSNRRAYSRTVGQTYVQPNCRADVRTAVLTCVQPCRADAFSRTSASESKATRICGKLFVFQLRRKLCGLLRHRHWTEDTGCVHLLFPQHSLPSAVVAMCGNIDSNTELGMCSELFGAAVWQHLHMNTELMCKP